MTNVYQGFLHHYRVLTLGRVMLLLLVLAVFGICTYPVQQPEATASYFPTFFS